MVGFGINCINGKLEETDVLKRSTKKSEQYWERTPLPEGWKEKRIIEKKRQHTDPEYFDQDLERFRAQEWNRRFKGVWFYNNGVPIYITGEHYMYLNWWHLDTGYPEYRNADRKRYYVQDYCIQDPLCAGMIDVSNRRSGKSYRAGLFLYNQISMKIDANGGLQSKTDPDAKNLFKGKIITPYRRLPDFFRPEVDDRMGSNPEKELRFIKTPGRGKKAIQDIGELGLNSFINFMASEKFAYDGWKLHRYVGDEVGKCFGKGTKIRMYDGSIKNVEDITNGERVMGDDSTPRLVSGVKSGSERMYKISANNGSWFECNESHILSLKWARRDRKYKNYSFGDTVNISLTEFFTLPACVKKHLMLWKAGVGFPAVKHDLEPYFLGLWLGDGSSGDAGFTTNDNEVLEYMQSYAETNNVSVKIEKNSKYDYNISSKSRRKGSNAILTGLQELNLIKNKHIPDSYLIDSRNNRVQLLAGLIDSDGYLNKKNDNPSYYEITQKREGLAIQITDLANSCGLKATLKKKVASMVRADGTIYKCDVYRVNIYGELNLIPCKVERKKAKVFAYHKNRRNPLRSGFKIEPIGVGDYYGFAVDKNHLFLLHDGTVVHNTEEVSVYDRWQVVKYCLRIGKNWIGKALLTTTVEFIDTEKSDFEKLWQESNPGTRDKNGHTTTGLYKYFTPAYENFEVDKYGNADEEQGKTFYLNTREGLAEDPKSLESEIKKNPFTEEELFRANGDGCLYNSIKMNNRMSYLSWNQNLIEKGNFIWENGKKDTKVVWEPNNNGRWYIAKDHLPEHNNRVEYSNNQWEPRDTNNFVSGCDPFDHDTPETGGSKASSSIKNRKTKVHWCFYFARPPLAELFYEDMIMQCVFAGCQQLAENNKPGIIRYFRKRGYAAFLVHLVGYKEPGVPSTVDNKKDASIMCEAYIEQHSDRMYFIEQIKQGLKFDIKKTEKSDAWMGFMWTEYADNYKYFDDEPDNKDIIEVSSLFREYDFNESDYN